MSKSLERAQARQEGRLTTRMVRSRVSAGVLADGTKVSSELISARLRWLAEMVKDQAQKRIFEVWTAQAVLDLPAHPSHAYVAMLETFDPLIWPPPNQHASQRVLRLAEELAGRSLRSVGRSLSILEALVNFEPLPADTTEAEQRNLWRSVQNYRDVHGFDPQSVYDLIFCPDFSAGFYNCPLDAADDQQVRLAGDQLSVLLPVCELPTKHDWVWHTLTLDLNAYAQRRYPQGAICKPSLRVTPKDLYFLVPLDLEVPELLVDQIGPSENECEEEDPKNLGVDWGKRRLLTAAITVKDAQDQVSTTGRPFYFDAGGLQDKQARRRAEGYHLKDEIARLEKDQQAAGKVCLARATKIEVLQQEKDRLWRRVSQCDRQLEHSAAKWVIETALAEGAKTIAREDLDSLEARDLGRKTNAGVSNQVRGGLQQRIGEKAELAGLEVVSVAARGTSSLCSRCHKASVFWQAPDRKLGRVSPKTGNQAAHQNWLICEGCRSSDRDHAAGESIGARGFDAPRSRRNSRRKPVAGPASRRPIKLKSEKTPAITPQVQARISAQAIPFPLYQQAQPAPRSCRAVSSRRVDRGSAIPGSVQLPERRTLTLLESTETPSRVLDGLANGYWRRIQFSRPRAMVQPASSVSTQGM